MNSKMDPMGRAITDYWNARSSDSRQARLDGRVVTSKDEVKTKKADREGMIDIPEGEHYDYLARITKINR